MGLQPRNLGSHPFGQTSFDGAEEVDCSMELLVVGSEGRNVREERENAGHGCFGVVDELWESEEIHRDDSVEHLSSGHAEADLIAAQDVEGKREGELIALSQRSCRGFKEADRGEDPEILKVWEHVAKRETELGRFETPNRVGCFAVVDEVSDRLAVFGLDPVGVRIIPIAVSFGEGFDEIVVFVLPAGIGMVDGPAVLAARAVHSSWVAHRDPEVMEDAGDGGGPGAVVAEDGDAGAH